MSFRSQWAWCVTCLVFGVAFGDATTRRQEAGVFLQPGPGPIIEQTSYYAKPGMTATVYEHRLHASDVREKNGLPRGRIFRRVGGSGDLPDVIWQLEYIDAAAMRRDLNARAESREFEQVRERMRTLIDKFSRGFYQSAAP